MDGVERVMVLGIFIVIVLILGVLAWDASNEEPAAALTSGADGGPEVSAASLSEGDSRGELRQGPSLREELETARAPLHGGATPDSPAPKSGKPRAGNRAADRPDERVATGSETHAPGTSATPDIDMQSGPTGASPYLSNSVNTTAPEPPAPAFTTYTVKEGDTAWRITKQHYGTGDLNAFLDLIQDANPGVDLEQLGVGQVLKLPAKVPAAAKLPSPAERVAAGEGRTYKVVEGDTLHGIAADELGNGGRWEEIYRMNRHLIASPSDLSVGVLLVLPEK